MDFNLLLCYCLSCVLDPEPYVAFFQKKAQFLATYQGIADFYCQTYTEHRTFPEFSQAMSALGADIGNFSAEEVLLIYGTMENAIEIVWNKVQKDVSAFELRQAEANLIYETDTEKKRQLLADYTQLILASNDDVKSHVTRDYEIDIGKKIDRNDPDGLVYPITKLNDDLGTLGPGNSTILLGAPGAFKTTFALNIVFLNTVIRSKKCCYFYLEDMQDQYQKKLLSRFSVAYGPQIHKDQLLQGTDDDTVLQTIRAQKLNYDKMRKGELHYYSMSGMSGDPITFAHQFGKYATEHEIDYVIFDHAQRMDAFRPARTQKYEYLNQFFTMLSSLALGQYDNRPFSSIILSQMTKESIKKGNRNGGRYDVSDCAEIGALERDGYNIISLYVNDVLKSAGQMKYQVLKARNAITTGDPVETYVDAIHCYIGDVSGMQDVYSPMSLHDNFGDSDFGKEFDL